MSSSFGPETPQNHVFSHFCPTEASEQCFSRLQLELKTRITNKESLFAHLNMPTLCPLVFGTTFTDMCPLTSAWETPKNAKNTFSGISAILPGFGHFRRRRAFSKLAKNYKNAQKWPKNARNPQQTWPACPANPPQWTQTASIDNRKYAFSGIFSHFHEKRLSI